jgi:hypothetical protein
MTESMMAAAVARAKANTGFKTIPQGAATQVLLATSPALEGVGGRYFEDCNQALPATEGGLGGVQPYALDPATAQALWEASTRLIKDAS